MIGTRTYYCEQCKKCIDFQKNDIPECKCGKIFGVTGKLSDFINIIHDDDVCVVYDVQKINNNS